MHTFHGLLPLQYRRFRFTADQTDPLESAGRCEIKNPVFTALSAKSNFRSDSTPSSKGEDRGAMWEQTYFNFSAFAQTTFSWPTIPLDVVWKLYSSVNERSKEAEARRIEFCLYNRVRKEGRKGQRGGRMDGKADCTSEQQGHRPPQPPPSSFCRSQSTWKKSRARFERH